MGLKNVRFDDEEYTDEEWSIVDYGHYHNMTVYDDLDYIEVDVIQDVYKGVEVERDGEIVEDYKLVKKDVKSKKTIWKSEISDVKQVINDKGNIRTKRVELGIKYKDPIIVVGSYKELKKAIFDLSKKDNKVIGYKFY